MTTLTTPTSTTNGAPALDGAGAPPLGIDDLGRLIESVNAAAEGLQQTHESLQTEVKQLKRELAEANAKLRRSRALAALGEMAAGIAHEIRNPLGSIQLYVQVLGDDLADAPPQKDLCGKISRAVTDLDRIVHDVLHFARETRPAPAPTTTRRLVDEALDRCTAAIAESNATVEVAIAPDAEALEADESLVIQAIVNVVRNAVDAVVEHGAAPRIAVRAERARARRSDGRSTPSIVIAIEDNGPGIPEEVVERMFNPFFTTRATGTGLGLAIVHRIVDAHGGHIDVRRGPDAGARVELWLPARPHAEAPEITVLPGAGRVSPPSEDAA